MKRLIETLEPSAWDVPLKTRRIKIEKRMQRDGTCLYAVTEGGNVLARINGHHHEFEYEPLPSSRDDEFIKRTRFASLEDACDAIDAYIDELNGWRG